MECPTKTLGRSCRHSSTKTASQCGRFLDEEIAGGVSRSSRASSTSGEVLAAGAFLQGCARRREASVAVRYAADSRPDSVRACVTEIEYFVACLGEVPRNWSVRRGIPEITGLKDYGR